jgi:FlaG/FlaF family flagellin (archaellin)
MLPVHRILVTVALLATLSACSGGEVRKAINPPRASIQQITVQPDGQWQLAVRLQNFSNVPTSFTSVDVKLTVGGQEAGNIALTPTITIGPESADVLNTVLRPALGAKLQAASALSEGQSVRYAVAGTIVTKDPKGSYSVSYDSTLNPAPGLNGVLR